MEKHSRLTTLLVTAGLILLTITLIGTATADEKIARKLPSTSAFPEQLGDQLAAEILRLPAIDSAGTWSEQHTPNFRVFAAGFSRQDMQQLGDACETSLTALRSVWFPHEPRCDWTPKCTVVFHRTPEGFDRAVGQGGSGSWGCTTVKKQHGRVAMRRIDICAPTLRRLAETFPHELTHAIFADHFLDGNVPRWLDEGAAVLAEPQSKAARRGKNNEDPGNGEPLFRSAELLLAQSYPVGEGRHAFYAESYELVQLLIVHGGAERLTNFAKSATQDGYEKALHMHYGLTTLSQLDDLRRQEIRKAGLVAQASPERREAASATLRDSSQTKGLAPFREASYRGVIPLHRGRGN